MQQIGGIVRIQIIEPNAFLDCDQGIAVEVKFNVSDVRDISQKKGATSKTIKLSNTKNNHSVLGALFDVNSSGVFLQYKSYECVLIKNGIAILENAVLQLTKVNITHSNGIDSDQVTYECVVKEKTSDLFTKLGSKEITELNLSEFSHEKNLANVVASFNHNWNNGYKYLLPYTPTATYPLNEIKPAVYLKKILEKLFSSNGYTLNIEPTLNQLIEKLIIPSEGKPVADDQVNQNNNIVIVSKNALQSFEQTAPTNPILIGNATQGVFTLPPFQINTEIQDLSNNYDSALSIYTCPQIPVNFYDGLDVKVKIEYTYEFYVKNYNITFPAFLRFAPPIGANPGLPYNPSLTGVRYRSIFDLRPTTPPFDPLLPYTWQQPLINNGVLVPQGQVVTAGQTLVIASGTTSQEITKEYFSGNSTYFVFSAGSVTPTNTANGWYWTNNLISPTGQIDVRFGCRISNIKVSFIPEIGAEYINSSQSIQKSLPYKIKQSDLLKSTLQMFNAFLVPNESNSNQLTMITRDKFYTNGAQKDWTKKIDKSKSKEIRFISDLQKSKTTLSYKDDNDNANKKYKDEIRETYGQIEYKFKTEHTKDVERKEIIFSPTPSILTIFGAHVPFFGGEEKVNIRLLFDGGNRPCNQFNISTTVLNIYPYMGHFDNPINPNFDLNFGVCDYYFYNPETLTNRNLFENFHRNTYSQLEDGRILKAFFNLDDLDILNLKLNDRIRIFGSWWNINNLTYNATSNGSTAVELISIEDSATIKITKKKIPFIPTILTVLKEISDKIIIGRNIVTSLLPTFVSGEKNNVKQPAIVIGNGNTVNTKNAIVIGDDQNVNESGLYVKGRTELSQFPIIEGKSLEMLCAFSFYDDAMTSIQQVNQGNIASGIYSLAIGQNNKVTAKNAIALGVGNDVQGINGFIHGESNISGISKFVKIFGNQNRVNNHEDITIEGNNNTTTKGGQRIIGQNAKPTTYNEQIRKTTGGSIGNITMSNLYTSATIKPLYCDGIIALEGFNILINSTYRCEAKVIATNTGTNRVKTWLLGCVVQRIGATTVIKGTPTSVTGVNEAGMNTVSAAFVVNAGLNRLEINCGGANANTIVIFAEINYQRIDF